MMFAGIEAGGTKFIAVIGQADGTVIDRAEFPTETPDVTLKETVNWLVRAQSHYGPFFGLGIASFGPLQLQGSQAEIGLMLDTPKVAWRGAHILKPFQEVFSCPMVIDTDVNAAALAESRLGAGQGQDCAYITVGTGIGMGMVSQGRCVHGLLHPEAGHIFPRRHEDDVEFTGVCPTHGDCLEGLAGGAALLARTQGALSTLDDHDPLWKFEAYYLAQLCVSLALIASPYRIVIGGGVMRRQFLLSMIQSSFKQLIRGYTGLSEFSEKINDYIVSPQLGFQAGAIGALLLAERAFQSHQQA
jgi:fructokinase